MRNISIAVIFCFVVFSLLLSGNSEALIFIDLPADVTGVDVERTTEDDENDDDVWELADAQKVFFVEVTNELRRYVGVYIDRIIQGQGVTPINNGENDEYIRPVSEVFSYDFLSEFFWGDTPSSSRHYFLPVPDDLGPGDEALFRVKVVGPAWLGTIPFDLSGPNAPPESAQLVEATAYTLFETIVVPLIQLIVPSVKGDDLAALLEDFKGFVVLNSVKFHVMVEQGDYSAIIWEVDKWMANSTVVRNIVTSVIGGEGLVEALDQLGNFLEQPLQIAEWFNVMLHLAGADWLTQVDVNFVYPKVESLDPAEGQAGDIITIRGKGFDPYSDENSENNKVYFTEIDDLNGLPLTTLEAVVVDVPAEDTIVVQVPEGFYPGPVRVVVDGFESNDDVLFDEPMTSQLIINSPTEGETVSGVITIDVTLTDSPDPFPESQATLFVDGNLADQIEFSTADFGFSLDTSSLVYGYHTLGVTAIVNGQELNDSVGINIAETIIINPETGQPFGQDEVIVVAGDSFDIGDHCPPPYGGDGVIWLVKQFRSDPLYWPDRPWTDPEWFFSLFVGICDAYSRADVSNYKIIVWAAGVEDGELKAEYQHDPFGSEGPFGSNAAPNSTVQYGLSRGNYAHWEGYVLKGERFYYDDWLGERVLEEYHKLVSKYPSRDFIRTHLIIKIYAFNL